MSKVLVTGGSGYFGSLLIQKLLTKGYSCSVLDISDAGDRPQEVEYFQADIRDLSVVELACRNTEIVFHNVAQVPLVKDRKLFDSVNRQGTENLLQSCRKAGVSKVVYTSSSAVYGVPQSNPVTEEMAPHPQEAYGRAKLEGENSCRRHAAEGMDVTIIRPRTILGHGRLGIFQILFDWIREGHNVPVLGGGNNRYQFVHADDLADACILASKRPGPGLYHCGTDRFGTMREALEDLCRHAGTGSRVVSVPMGPAVAAMKLTSALGLSPLGPYHALMYGRSMYFDISRARKELGWSPKYSNTEMFRESYDWFCQNHDRIKVEKSGSAHRRAVNQGILNLLKWLK